jgi:NADPH:quinone reductase-like Zn-dependent oxidoreductase
MRKARMRAMCYREFGGPEVLRLEEAATPHAGPGRVLIAVRAVSVNPIDWKTRAGYLAEMVPTTFPAIRGSMQLGWSSGFFMSSGWRTR